MTFARPFVDSPFPSFISILYLANISTFLEGCHASCRKKSLPPEGASTLYFSHGNKKKSTYASRVQLGNNASRIPQYIPLSFEGETFSVNALASIHTYE